MNTVTTYRKHPKSIVTIDGEQYIPLKDFCSMTGLRPDSPIFDTVADHIVEQPATGRQRKPRRYISVDGWLRLYEHVFREWLRLRVPDDDKDLTVYDDDGEWRKPWHWYGEDKIVEMFDLEPFAIVRDEDTDGFDLITLESSEGIAIGGPVEEWIRYYMPAPSPWRTWRKHIVLDVAHPEFAELLVFLKDCSLQDAKRMVKAALQAQADIRDAEWRAKYRVRVA